ncbi:hypothetical protein ACJD0Z_07795 [Flavobacteriaceae bacterium M23B6Z8]
MKKFLIRGLLFMTCAVALGMILFYGSNKILRKNGNFYLGDDINQVVIGHSHSQCAINDSLIPGLKNVSNAGESYFYNYLKLKKILEQNPQVKTVFIEFSNNHIDTLMNQWIWGEAYMKRYSYLLPYSQKEDQNLIKQRNTKGYLKTLAPWLKSNLLHIFKNDYDLTDEIGGYRKLTRNHLDSILHNQDIKSDQDIQLHYPISQQSISYLQKMINTCKEYNIKPTLIRSPQHPKLKMRSNEGQYQAIRNTHFKHLVFLDFGNFPLADSFYSDLEHLNHRGAKVFTDKFRQSIEDYRVNLPISE